MAQRGHSKYIYRINDLSIKNKRKFYHCLLKYMALKFVPATLVSVYSFHVAHNR